MLREEIAVRMLAALIHSSKTPLRDNKKLYVDNAIAYADMFLRRIKQIPHDAQERSEQGQKRL